MCLKRLEFFSSCSYRVYLKSPNKIVIETQKVPQKNPKIVIETPKFLKNCYKNPKSPNKIFKNCYRNPKSPNKIFKNCYKNPKSVALFSLEIPKKCDQIFSKKITAT